MLANPLFKAGRFGYVVKNIIEFLMTLDKQIAEILLDTGSVKVSLDPAFTFTSGLKSPIYCDNRRLITHVDARDLIVQGFIDKTQELGWDFDAVAGTATAGIPWAAFVADKLKKPMVYIRPEPKGHGGGKQVEGDGELIRGKRVLIVEDLFSTGGSSIRSADAVIKELEGEVVGILAIFQYGMQEATDAFEASGYPNAALSNVNVLLDTALERGDLPQEDVDKILPFLDDPSSWFDNLNS